MNKLLILLFACMGDGFMGQQTGGEFASGGEKSLQRQLNMPNARSMLYSMGTDEEKKRQLAQLFMELQGGGMGTGSSSSIENDFHMFNTMMNSLPSTR
jgi:hypothetical protein